MLPKASAPVLNLNLNLTSKCFQLESVSLSTRPQRRRFFSFTAASNLASGRYYNYKATPPFAMDMDIHIDIPEDADGDCQEEPIHAQNGEADPPPAAHFGRLKPQRVRALAIKASRRRQETDAQVHHKPGPVVEDTHSKLESTSTAFTHQPRASQLQPTSSAVTRRKNVSVSHNELSPDKPQTRLIKKASQKEEASLRGWRSGRSRSIHSLNSELPDPMLLRNQRKFSTNTDFFSWKSFRDLGFSDFMIECLRKQLFHRPSHIQAMAFEPVVKGKTCILADQSGSGKTLAYLAPVIQRLRQEEVQGLSISLSQSPRVIILVPTAELASQVLDNCRSMSKCGVPFRSMVATGGFRQRTQLENLQQGVDVLIATPGRFMFLIKEGFLQLENLRCTVLDEVDVLFNDEDFELALQSLINSSAVSTQYLFVTATLPVDIYNKLVEVFPDCEVIMGPGVHRTSPGLEEVLVDCSGNDEIEKTPETAFLNKKSALLEIVEGSSVPKTIVFCNKIETCRKVENALKRFDKRGTSVRVLPFHAAVAQESRLANMKEFTNPGQDKVCQFLVCTDRASRGMDFSCGVDHVILFDFPRDPSEYVRRVGRTARGAGGKGKAFMLVVGKQVSLARRIVERNRKGHPLHDVPSV
ncbi:DEAD-box ATP-dependent RNA helicase 50 isoform X2 [Ziziphus jujuba]|uniref:DEAD-box ATP-dependent RNA helicase 50 isoform X2 n=1 Tax=Ziziphus jujuba TaxID=326968 RepID=A0A6P3Z744_ZIZJJ|nr:DEAD-box ATP-dependent RNA helicase 50 isoform X2 [Ziziphus jujuba]